MSLLSEPKRIGDWLKFEEDNLYCRGVLTVLAAASLPSGQVLGTESVFSKSAPYDNSDPAAAAAILLFPVTVEDAQPVTNIVDAANVSTITFPKPHGLIVGDIIGISGATVDADLNSNRAVATVADSLTITCASANVTDTTYTEATLRVTKLNHQASAIVRGPAEISSNGLNWGTSDGTGITAGLADLLTLGIVAKEGA